MNLPKQLDKRIINWPAQTDFLRMVYGVDTLDLPG